MDRYEADHSTERIKQLALKTGVIKRGARGSACNRFLQSQSERERERTDSWVAELTEHVERENRGLQRAY